MIPVAGSIPSGNGFNFSVLTNTAAWSHHGTSDGQQDKTNTPRLAQNLNPLNPKFAPLMSMYWGLGHSESVWNTQVYNRKNKTGGGGTALFDYVDWFLKFSLDADECATLLVDYADNTLEITDWQLAKGTVDKLPNGSLKTSLLSQLASMRTTINAGRRRFTVDLGSATYPTTGNTNNITNINNNISVSNLVDEEGGSSSYNFRVINRFSTFQPQTEFTTRLQGQYLGFPKTLYRDGARALSTITNGSCEFNGLNNSKTYSLRIYHSADNADDFNAKADMRITVNGSAITQYSQFNTTRWIEYSNITPVSGIIGIAVAAPSGRDACVVAISLTENP